jgi:hypothetical protein
MTMLLALTLWMVGTAPGIPPVQAETYNCRAKAPRTSGWSTQSFSARSESEAVAKMEKLRSGYTEVSCVLARRDTPTTQRYHCRGKAPRTSGYNTDSFSARSESEAVSKYRKLRPSHSEVSCILAG